MMKARLLKRSEIEDEKWDSFVENSPQRSIYAYSWYLDCICGEWEAVLVEMDKKWVAIFPLNKGKKMGLAYSLSPYFSQYLGVLLSPEENSKSRVFQQTGKVLQCIIEALPADIHVFDFNCHPSLNYLLPFHWAGYDLSPRYTYWLDLDPGFDAIFKNFTKSVKSDITRARKEGIVCREVDSPEVLIDLLKDKKIISSQNGVVLERLWENVRQQGRGKMLHSFNKKGEVVSAASFLLDGDRMIYLLGASRPGPQKGANTLLILEAIRLCYQLNGIRYFDFEGSMIKPVENYFRAFNPEMKTYFRIQKNTLPWLYKALYKLKGKL